MIHVSIKVNCTACSALARLPAVYHALGMFQWLGGVKGLGQNWGTSLWPFVLQQLLTEQPAGKGNSKHCGEFTDMLFTSMGSSSDSNLDQKWKCFVWSSKRFCKTAECSTGGPTMKVSWSRVTEGCSKSRLKYCLGRQLQAASLSNFHILSRILVPVVCRLQPRLPYFWETILYPALG